MAQRQKTFLARSQTSQLKVVNKEFDGDNLQNAINLLCYGVDVIKHRKKGKKDKRFIYISEDDPIYLQFIKKSGHYEDSRIPLLDVHELREEATNEEFSGLVVDLTLQISYGDEITLFEFKSKQEKDLWWQGLQFFIEEAVKTDQQMARSQEFSNYIGNKMFSQVDASLNFQQVKKLIQQMNVQIPDAKLQAQFNKFDTDNSGEIGYEEFQKIVKAIVNYEILKPIYRAHASYARGLTSFEDDQGLMTRSDFHHFITQVQKQNITQTELHELFNSFAKESSFYSFQKLMSFTKFMSFLINPLNSAFDEEKKLLYQDMTRPLTDYYVNSSHNTYLMSNQLTGQSSIQAYINAFQKGCRCVELDCWDGANGQPIIYHGYTMTTRISFVSVVETINEYAFKYSPYPLILSLEVHCCLEQQTIMADIMKEIFGEQILLIHEDFNNTQYYPSPDTLKNKIILKGKGSMQLGLDHRMGKTIDIINEQDIAPEDQQPQADKTEAKESMNPEGNLDPNNNKQTKIIPVKSEAKIQDSWQMCDLEAPKASEEQGIESQKILLNITNIQVSLRPKYKNSDQNCVTQNMNGLKNDNEDQSDDDSNDEGSEEEEKPTKHKQGKSKDAISLVAITAMYGIAISLIVKRSVWNISSLEEKKLAKIYKTHEKELMEFHKKYFTRIYPAGKRVDSSNYDPILAFNSGSQITALNFQTLDMPMLLNLCKFQENGGLEGGYLLKPSWMLSHIAKTRVASEFTRVIRTINIHVIFGQNLQSTDKQQPTMDIIDPFIKITLRGTAADELLNPPSKSQTIKNNGLNPKFDFKWMGQICCTDLAIIVFEVFDDHTMTNKFIGWTAIPVTCLKQGYRNIQLLNKQLKPIQNSMLFASIQFDPN